MTNCYTEIEIAEDAEILGELPASLELGASMPVHVLPESL